MMLQVCTQNYLWWRVRVAGGGVGEGIWPWHIYVTLQSGLWSQNTKPPTLQFLNLQLWLPHKSSVCINNVKPTKMVNGTIRHFITTTWIIRLLFKTYNLHLSVSLMVIVTSIYLRFYIEVGFGVGSWYIFTNSDSTQNSFWLLTLTPQLWISPANVPTYISVMTDCKFFVNIGRNLIVC
jgi:hypothetical protein